MRRCALFACACALVALPAVHAQSPATQPRTAATAPAAPAALGTTTLPVRRVVLYKNGVGYFEHVGRVRGNQSVAIDFNSAQLNDVLKSLTTVDLGNGRIGNVSFNSDAPLARRLGSQPLALGDHATLAELLTALRGARLEVRTGGRTIVGRLLSVEQRPRGKDGDTFTDELTIVTDAGAIRTVDLTPAVDLRLAERDSSEQVGSYLSLLASNRSQDRRRMTIATTGTGVRDVLVGYVSEVPIWKTTYRVVLSATGAPLLQGWAIVDNTIGEDWNGVELSLVAGAPQSFVQALSEPLYVQRPIVGVSRVSVAAPQVHGGTLATIGDGLTGRVVDPEGSPMPGVSVTAIHASGRRLSATTDARGDYVLATTVRGTYRLEFSVAGFETTTLASVEFDGAVQSLPDVRMSIGTVTESVSVTGDNGLRQVPRGRVGSGVGGGFAGGTTAGATPAPPAPLKSTIAQGLADIQTAQAQELGDLFEYRVAGPITIKKNQSALVPILQGEVGIERVSIWNDRTGARPLRALWLTNSSGLTLDAGPFTVLEDATFAGEGLLDPLKPGEKRLLSYAVDLGVQVESRRGDDQHQVSRVRIEHGTAIQQSEQRARKVYTIRNSDTTPRTVVVEHPIRAGWTLVGGSGPVETSLSAYRFAVPVAAKGLATLTVEERRPTEARYAISQLTDDQIALFVRDARQNGRIVQTLAPIRAKKAEIVALSTQISAHEREAASIGSDQNRLRENMRSLKGSSGEQELLKRYVAELNQQEDRIAAVRRETADLDQQRARASAELDEMVGALSIDVDLALDQESTAVPAAKK